jgi:hypothetical protein
LYCPERQVESEEKIIKRLTDYYQTEQRVKYKNVNSPTTTGRLTIRISIVPVKSTVAVYGIPMKILWVRAKDRTRRRYSVQVQKN